MMVRVLTLLMVLACAFADKSILFAEEPHPHHEIKLSPELLNLLRAEMREISTRVQSIALALATADWKTIQDNSDKIRKSYVMEKNLTSDQEKELTRSLPERFKQLDAEFHQRAARLGTAASAHDAELAAFHYSRLIENCATCHSIYARARFPRFAPLEHQNHHH